MRPSRTVAAVVLALVIASCAARRNPGLSPDVHETSGFLDEYSRLRPGGTDDLAFVYRNTEARWTGYDKILLEPVTLWRSGRDSLAPIAEEDLLRVVSSFEEAVRQRLGDGFQLVDEPSPGTLRLRLAITEARAADPVLDVLTAVAEHDVPRTDGPLSPELRRFIDAA